MRTYYEMMGCFFSTAYTRAAEVTESSHVSLLRKRYYANLSFLDAMAKAYGEMGRISQCCLYLSAGGLTATGCLIFNPVALVLGGLSLQLLFCISAQYRALEFRFLQLVNDLAQSEKQLNDALKVQEELSESISMAGQHHQRLVNTLEQISGEVSHIKQTVVLKAERVTSACALIEKSAQQTQTIMEDLSRVAAQTEAKEQLFLATLSEVSAKLENSIQAFDKKVHEPWETKLAETRAYREGVDTFLAEHFAVIFAHADGLELSASSLTC